jgi:hypothetical protein
MSPGRLTTVLCCCLPTRKLSAKVGPLFPSSAGPETVSLSLVFCRAEAGGDAGGDPTASAACFFTSHGRSTTTTPSLGHERGQQNVHFSTAYASALALPINAPPRLVLISVKDPRRGRWEVRGPRGPFRISLRFLLCVVCGMWVWGGFGHGFGAVCVRGPLFLFILIHGSNN